MSTQTSPAPSSRKKSAVTCGSQTPEVASIRPDTSRMSTRMRLPPETGVTSRERIRVTSGWERWRKASGRRRRPGRARIARRIQAASRGWESSRAPTAGSTRPSGESLVIAALSLGKRGPKPAAAPVPTIEDVSVPKASRRARRAETERTPRPLLSIVVPVYNGGPEIVGNIGTIRAAAGAGLAPEDVELLVVSDGSIDGTAERLLEARSDVDMRVIHYERNLGKGYAFKLGALAADGDWIALVDSDLDLDPAAVPSYLEIARRDEPDLAIGSKRHPASIVEYPRSRRVLSWGYQQLNRLLFGLNVRDTQVGLKVFRRQVAEEVFPLLLVKRFAIDLELLAVARALGFSRVRELPVRLDYKFSGSGVGWRAVARALWCTAAIFHRLRIIRTYQRKRS